MPTMRPISELSPETLREIEAYKPDTFKSDQIVRWCPGCGDYSILAQMQKIMPEVCRRRGIPRERVVFISGIGCSSRFPYYMNTYGFHTIHGRAPTFATGLKIARPELDIWVVTGDGDGLSIGGNHLVHCLRRNVDLKILLFNNRIYGLTKGQYSPTSEFGKKTKSTPMGSVDQPINALCIALASEATFVARTLDTDVKHLAETLERAAAHRGVAFVEIYQNCNVFNDGAFSGFYDKPLRGERMLYLEHGKPLIFGDKRDKAVRLNGFVPEVIQLGDKNSEKDALVHDESAPAALAFLLARLNETHFPVPVGVFRQIERPTFEALMDRQVEDARTAKGAGDLQSLINSGETWTVEG
jgi:2-oxoglutarate ferredoxin oxidoreductase subunit beta